MRSRSTDGFSPAGLALPLALALGFTSSAALADSSDLSTVMPEGVARARAAVATLVVEKLMKTPAGEKMDDISACTGFLIGSQFVMTNHHCIARRPEQFVRVQAIFREFPQDANLASNAVAAVSKIQTYQMTAITYDSTEQDIAILELEEPVSIRGVEPLPIAAKSDSFPKHPWKISSTFDARYISEPRIGYLATLDIEMCSTTGFEKLNVDMKGCTARPGNSGSPLLNNSGEVIGILKSIYQELPPMVVSGTEYVVGKVSAVCGTPAAFLGKSLDAVAESHRRLLADIRIDTEGAAKNFTSVGHIEQLWPKLEGKSVVETPKKNGKEKKK
ncbi:MAG: S1 family peptidase [Bacteriovoracia bacterium]